MKIQALLLLLLAVCFQTCKQQVTESTATPEDVARKWQILVDQNQFKEAREISTPRAADMIDLIENMLFDSEDEATLSKTDFLEFKCKDNGSRASCHYVIEEGGDRISDSIILIKKNKQWLVDIPEEEELLQDDEDIEALFKQYEKSLNQALLEKK